MSRVYFENGTILEGSKMRIKRAIQRTIKDEPQCYWFKLPERWFTDYVQPYWERNPIK